jgi:hypothetical protein
MGAGDVERAQELIWRKGHILRLSYLLHVQQDKLEPPSLAMFLFTSSEEIERVTQLSFLCPEKTKGRLWSQYYTNDGCTQIDLISEEAACDLLVLMHDDTRSPFATPHCRLKP